MFAFEDYKEEPIHHQPDQLPLFCRIYAHYSQGTTKPDYANHYHHHGW